MVPKESGECAAGYQQLRTRSLTTNQNIGTTLQVVRERVGRRVCCAVSDAVGSSRERHMQGAGVRVCDPPIQRDRSATVCDPV